MLTETYNLIEQIVSSYGLEKIDQQLENELLNAGSPQERLFLKMNSISDSQNPIPSFVLYKTIQDLINKKISFAEVKNKLVSELNLPAEIAEAIANVLSQNEFILKEIAEAEEQIEIIPPDKSRGAKGLGQELV